MRSDHEKNPLSSIIHLRLFEERDEAAVVTLGESSDMGTLTTFENITVAIHNKTLVGFIRLNVYENVHYVNPVVVASSWHKRGLGSLLMKHALNMHGELRFVARGYAVPFYTKLGCTPIPWSMIAEELIVECKECEQLSSCAPQPMHMLEA